MFYKDKIELLRLSVKEMSRIWDDICQSTSQTNDLIWNDASKIFQYVMNLSAEDFELIRLHTSLITGDFIFSYWGMYPPIDPDSFARSIGYTAITEDIPENYHIGEPLYPKNTIPLGVNYNNKVINKNIARYQSCISNLYYMGVLAKLKEKKDKCSIIEIGGGYGGLAHHISQILNQKSTYIIVDIPIMLMFSGSYLMLNNPEKKVYIYNKETFTKKFIEKDIFNYDYVLLPPYSINILESLDDVDLMINMQSFQEMSSLQVEEYVKVGSKILSGYLYCNNIDRHPNNESKNLDVTSIISKYFKLFPSPETYNKGLLNSTHPWFYKFYFGISKHKNKDFLKDSRLKIRVYSPEIKKTNSTNNTLVNYPIQWKEIKNN